MLKPLGTFYSPVLATACGSSLHQSHSLILWSCVAVVAVQNPQSQHSSLSSLNSLKLTISLVFLYCSPPQQYVRYFYQRHGCWSFEAQRHLWLVYCVSNLLAYNITTLLHYSTITLLHYYTSHDIPHIESMSSVVDWGVLLFACCYWYCCVL